MTKQEFVALGIKEGDIVRLQFRTGLLCALFKGFAENSPSAIRVSTCDFALSGAYNLADIEETCKVNPSREELVVLYNKLFEIAGVRTP